MPTPEQTATAYRVLDYIEAHPDRHNQNSWVDAPPRVLDVEFVDVDHTLAEQTCGTTACFAGWTVLLNGGSIRKGYQTVGTDEHVIYTARMILGLDYVESHELFYAAIDLDDVRRVIHDIYGPRPEVLTVPVDWDEPALVLT